MSKPIVRFFETIFHLIIKHYFPHSIDAIKTWGLGINLIFLFAILNVCWLWTSIKKFDAKDIALQKICVLNELYSEAPTQSTNGINPAEEILFQMESVLMNYLKNYPQDTEMWLKLTMVEYTPTFEDYDRIEKYINSILEYDKNNIQALLILADAQCAYRGGISDDLFIRLQDCCNTTTDKELLSMIYLAIAWYYEYKDEKKYEQALLKSIDYCNKYVNNYEYLGELYFKRGQEADSKKIITLASANVRKISQDDNSVRDITDVTPFFDEFYKGYSDYKKEFRKYT